MGLAAARPRRPPHPTQSRRWPDALAVPSTQHSEWARSPRFATSGQVTHGRHRRFRLRCGWIGPRRSVAPLCTSLWPGDLRYDASSQPFAARSRLVPFPLHARSAGGRSLCPVVRRGSPTPMAGGSRQQSAPPPPRRHSAHPWCQLAFDARPRNTPSTHDRSRRCAPPAKRLSQPPQLSTPASGEVGGHDRISGCCVGSPLGSRTGPLSSLCLRAWWRASRSPPPTSTSSSLVVVWALGVARVWGSRRTRSSSSAGCATG